LLQKALEESYRDHRIAIPGHLAMLEIVTGYWRSGQQYSKAARVLAKGLTDFRSDDVTMWLSLRGQAMCGGQTGLERARGAFEALRRQLLVQNASLAAPLAPDDDGEPEPKEWLQ